VIVIDASSLIKYILREDGWKDISYFIRERRPLYSVDHLVKEVGNAIWKHCSLHKIIDKKSALKLYDGLKILLKTKVIIIEPESDYLNEALQLALKHGITLYDSLYLVQAEKHGEILTSDKKQAGIAERLGIRVHLVL